MSATIPKTAESAPPKTAPVPLLLDTERGSKSVRGSIEAGKIERAHVRTFLDAEKVVWALERKQRPMPSGLILDTINALAAVTLQDVVKENPNGLWANRASLKASYNDYGSSNGLIIRLLRVARAFKIPVIITAHDGEREDDDIGATMHFPDLPRQLRHDVIGNADTVLRLSRSSNMVKMGSETYPKGTRLVQCMPTDTVYAKIRVPDNLPPAPDVIGNTSASDWKPVIAKLNTVSGGLLAPDDEGEISPVILYGAPGVGKTRLAVELLLQNEKGQK